MNINNQIDLDMPVNQVIEENPEVLDLLIELGFTPLKNKFMRMTVGSKVSLNKGLRITGISKDKLISTLQCNGYEVIESGQ